MLARGWQSSIPLPERGLSSCARHWGYAAVVARSFLQRKRGRNFAAHAPFGQLVTALGLSAKADW